MISTYIFRILLAFFLLASVLMEMASYTISILQPFVGRRDLLPDVNGGVGRLPFFRYGPSDLASPDRSWFLSADCREEICPRNIYPGCYVLDNGDSYSRFASDVDQAVRLLLTGILVLVLLPMLIDYSNGCVCQRSLCTAAKIKIMGEPSLVFTGCDLVSISFRSTLENYKMTS